MKRFLDDIFKIFVGTTKNLHLLFDEMNQMPLSIKFTMTHTSNTKETIYTRCSCQPLEAKTFLDTTCKIKNGKILFDLYKKPTDRNMYLLPSSWHPLQKEWLDNRGYQHNMVSAGISKVIYKARRQKVVKPSQQKRPISVVSWDPRLPSIDAIQNKHYRAMTSLDPYLKEVYPEAPFVAYKRPKNIYLIRAKLPPQNLSNPERQLKGMKRSKKNHALFAHKSKKEKMSSITTLNGTY